MNNRPVQSRCVLGVDLGTSSCKVSLVHEWGSVIHSTTAAYPTHAPQPGWAEQDPQDWITAATQAVVRLMTSPQAAGCDVQGIGLTCAAHIGVLLDEQHQPLRRAILWNDLRSASQARDLHETQGKLILHQSGQIASCSWTLAHLRWVLEHEPSVHARIRRILLSKDYLAWRLTGEMATDHATAVSSQLYDVTTYQWSDRLCALAGVTTDMLPEVVPARTIVGRLRADMASAMHLPADIPVVTGTLDSATELLAADCIRPGDRMIRLATAGGLQIVTNQLHRHEKRITYPHVYCHTWYVQAGTSSCASAVQWARDRFAPGWSWEKLIDCAAASPPGSQGLLFHPYLQGERAPYWNPHLKAGFTGLTLAHDTGDLLRSVLEGTCFSIGDAMRVMEDLPASNLPIKIVGGGSRNALWVAILASVLNTPLVPQPEVDSALGAAILAWQSLGHETASFVTHASQPVNPDPHLADLYHERFEVYQSIAQRMLLTSQDKKVPLS